MGQCHIGSENDQVTSQVYILLVLSIDASVSPQCLTSEKAGIMEKSVFTAIEKCIFLHLSRVLLVISVCVVLALTLGAAITVYWHRFLLQRIYQSGWKPETGNHAAALQRSTSARSNN